MSYPYGQPGYGGPPQYGQQPPPHYPPQGGQYPPPAGQYPPQGHYPPPGQHHPPAGPPPGGHYQQPHHGHYPPPGGPPPPGGQYPPPHAPAYPPPQQGHYPPPSHSPYPPPQGSYPPPHGQPGYGAPPGPPAGHHGAPQYPPAHHGHGVPPHGAPPGGSFATPPSVGYGATQINWNALPDAQALRSAMKGFGTNEKVLIRTLATKDPLQVEAIRNSFQRDIGRNLQKDIESETSGWFEKGLVALQWGPLLHDVHMLREALKGAGTNEDVLNDVLLGRSNADLNAIKSAYQRQFNRALENDVKDDLSMKTQQHFLIVLGANRNEDSVPVNPQAIEQEVRDLYSATQGKVGTDEMLVCSILSTRNDAQIHAINAQYERQFRTSLQEVIRKEFSGHMQDALLFQLRSALNKPVHAASLLEDAMAGAGTKDRLLVSRVVRFHWDQRFMAEVKRAYQDRFRKNLASRIKGETSGDYERLLLACIGESV